MIKPVSIIMGSDSDLETVKPGAELLREFGVGFEIRVLSAHRSPKELARYVEAAPERGVKVFIAAAGGSAALAGVIASLTVLPVIGIPMETRSLKGIDSLLSTVQMPAGIPVACMGLGKAGSKNAALLALAILGTGDKKIRRKIASYRLAMCRKIKKIKIKL